MRVGRQQRQREAESAAVPFVEPPSEPVIRVFRVLFPSVASRRRHGLTRRHNLNLPVRIGPRVARVCVRACVPAPFAFLSRDNGNERGPRFRRALQAVLAQEQPPAADIRQGERAAAAALQNTLLRAHRGEYGPHSAPRCRPERPRI